MPVHIPLKWIKSGSVHRHPSSSLPEQFRSRHRPCLRFGLPDTGNVHPDTDPFLFLRVFDSRTPTAQPAVPAAASITSWLHQVLPYKTWAQKVFHPLPDNISHFFPSCASDALQSLQSSHPHSSPSGASDSSPTGCGYVKPSAQPDTPAYGFVWSNY